jgi:hypothetical protein
LGCIIFISRVIHPLLVYPEEPKFESRINEIARLISSKIPNYEDIGHIVGYVLSARKNIKMNIKTIYTKIKICSQISCRYRLLDILREF